jgi:glycosyltransferase involved in cell wall biosynthesis
VRIAINTRFLLHGRTLEGIARYTFEITKNLVLAHPEHEFYFFFDRPYDNRYIFAKNVHPIVIQPAARHPILFYLWFEWSVPKYLKKLDIDVFFSTDNFLSLSTTCPTLLTVHDIAFLHYPENIPFAPRKYYQYYMPKFLQRADHLLPVSKTVKKDIADSFGISEDKMTVVYNALPSSFYGINQTDKVNKENCFVLAGSINPRKNTYTILKAFQLFANENTQSYKLKLIGRHMGNPSSELSKLIKILEEEGKLVHLTNVDDAQLIHEIRTAKALLYISKFEGFGIPILEAMECGTPVITSDVSSMPEVAGGAALTVNPHDEVEIANAMHKISKDETLVSQLIARGYERVKDFSYEASAKIVYDCIEKLYNNKKGLHL